MFKNWLYRRDLKALLQSDYEYSIGEAQEPGFDAACAQCQHLSLALPDAAAHFIDGACRALPQPLSANDAEFVERMSLRMLQAMNRGRASASNFLRANRLYLLAKGVPLERLSEVDEMVEAFMKAMADLRLKGLVYDGAASLSLMLEMAVSRRLLQREQVGDMPAGTMSAYSRNR